MMRELILRTFKLSLDLNSYLGLQLILWNAIIWKVFSVEKFPLNLKRQDQRSFLTSSTTTFQIFLCRIFQYFSDQSNKSQLKLWPFFSYKHFAKFSLYITRKWVDVCCSMCRRMVKWGKISYHDRMGKENEDGEDEEKVSLSLCGKFNLRKCSSSKKLKYIEWKTFLRYFGVWNVAACRDEFSEFLTRATNNTQMFARLYYSNSHLKFKF